MATEAVVKQKIEKREFEAHKAVKEVRQSQNFTNSRLLTKGFY